MQNEEEYKGLSDRVMELIRSEIPDNKMFGIELMKNICIDILNEICVENPRKFKVIPGNKEGVEKFYFTLDNVNYSVFIYDCKCMYDGIDVNMPEILIWNGAYKTTNFLTRAFRDGDNIKNNILKMLKHEHKTQRHY